MKAGNHSVGVRLRLVLAPGVAIGPGKADLLQGIRETGSIAAAGRGMAMSYKRAWLLVDAMNGQFAEPLVSANRGGSRHGGARLTATGEAVLDAYRRMESSTDRAVAEELAGLALLLPDRTGSQ